VDHTFATKASPSSIAVESKDQYTTSTMANQFKTPPPRVFKFLNLSFPAPRIALITMNRPEKLNAMNEDAGIEFGLVWPWFDNEPNLSVAIITGAGRAFCAGADLQLGAPSAGKVPKEEAKSKMLTRRMGKKPVIAAVNGLAHGGGFEMVVNCDLVVAAETAEFCLPEVKRGLIPFAGCLPRLIRTVGLQRAMEAALTGRRITAQTAYEWGLVNKVVDQKIVAEEALAYATAIAANSPDAIIAAYSGIRESWVKADVEDAVQATIDGPWAQLQRGENVVEGVRAFQEKRAPKWKPSKL
jgi:enoyl-CoA hydratase/carnithine racemase